MKSKLFNVFYAVLVLAGAYGIWKIKDLPKPQSPDWLLALICGVCVYGCMTARMLMYARSRKEAIDALLWPRMIAISFGELRQEMRERAARRM